jgi:RNA polymerase sigma factor (sigma-70 family)
VEPRAHNPAFTITHWSLILRARGESPFAAECLERLCARYWFPLYAFLRRQGHSKESAEDITQGFFQQLLAGDFLADIHPSKGRFRNFLLASLKNFAANQHDKGRAQKRGGTSTMIYLDAVDPEARYKLEPSTDLSPDRLFQRGWAMSVLEEAFQELREHNDAKEEWFNAVKPLLIGDSLEVTYKELAQKLGATESAVKVYVHRLRHRFGQAIRQVIWRTVERPEQVEAEIRELLLALS